MMLKFWLMLLVLLTATCAVAAAEVAPPLYNQVAGGEERVQVEKRTNVANLALERGMRWTVVVGQNRMKKPYRVNPCESIKINNTHIVPAELNDGLVINLPELNLYHFQNGVYQRRYALGVGKTSWPTPTGTYKIHEKRKNPIWNVPPSIQEEMEEMGYEVKQKVPPGPKNPLGKFYMGTTAWGVGIHATNRPWSVGYSVSHGCIRMLPKEIEQLFPQVQIGTPLKIVYRPIKIALTPQGRVFLEANLNIYQWELNAQEYVNNMASYYEITDRIDWSKVPAILRKRDGVAWDITKAPDPPTSATATSSIPPTSTEVRLSPLHGKDSKLE
jgi:L,D-transpeptidase ErfK/SrfK